MAGKRKSKSKSKPRRTGKKGRPVAGTPDWAPVFLKAICTGSHVRDACAEAQIDGVLPYHRRQTDEAFAKAWEEAGVIGTKTLEAEATRRAFHGTLKPVFHKGEEVGRVREYSDTLMMFLLRARKPKKYRDHVSMKHDGTVTHDVHHFADLSDAELAAEVERLEKLRDGADGAASAEGKA